MRIAYFDCFSGISGDMCLGALMDAGVSLKKLEEELARIPLGGYRLTAKKVMKASLSARKVDVVLKRDTRTRHSRMRKWKDIEGLIRKSSLPSGIQRSGLAIFRRLFEAEARVHGGTFEKVHLHELGALDCVVDVFGALIALDMLGIEKVYSSPINLGTGTVKTCSGMLPVPAPAVCEIVKGLPVYSESVRSELTTPTGAAIIREIASCYGDIPSMRLEHTGVGAGSSDFENWPNVLRIFIGDVTVAHGKKTHEAVIVIETDIDDMNPQLYEYVTNLLLKEGAFDVHLTQTLMKKGRPGVTVTVLCNAEWKDRLVKILFRETSTIGVRYYEVKRELLRREIRTMETEFGKVRVKYSGSDERLFRATPEYEDCRRIAKKLDVPLIDVVSKIKGKIDSR